MDLIGSELCKTFKFCGVRTPPGGFAPAGPSPRFARSGAPQKAKIKASPIRSYATGDNNSQSRAVAWFCLRPFTCKRAASTVKNQKRLSREKNLIMLQYHLYLILLLNHFGAEHGRRKNQKS